MAFSAFKKVAWSYTLVGLFTAGAKHTCMSGNRNWYMEELEASSTEVTKIIVVEETLAAILWPVALKQYLASIPDNSGCYWAGWTKEYRQQHLKELNNVLKLLRCGSQEDVMKILKEKPEQKE
jgi:hypothetical protein